MVTVGVLEGVESKLYYYGS